MGKNRINGCIFNFYFPNAMDIANVNTTILITTHGYLR